MGILWYTILQNDAEKFKVVFYAKIVGQCPHPSGFDATESSQF